MVIDEITVLPKKAKFLITSTPSLIFKDRPSPILANPSSITFSIAKPYLVKSSVQFPPKLLVSVLMPSFILVNSVKFSVIPILLDYI